MSTPLSFPGADTVFGSGHRNELSSFVTAGPAVVKLLLTTTPSSTQRISVINASADASAYTGAVPALFDRTPVGPVAGTVYWFRVPAAGTWYVVDGAGGGYDNTLTGAGDYDVLPAQGTQHALNAPGRDGTGSTGGQGDNEIGRVYVSAPTAVIVTVAGFPTLTALGMCLLDTGASNRQQAPNVADRGYVFLLPSAGTWVIYAWATGYDPTLSFTGYWESVDDFSSIYHEVFRDPFDRTTSSGLGTHGAVTYTFAAGDDWAFVDGAEAAQTSPNQSYYLGLPHVPKGAVQFDFFTTSNRNDDALHYKVSGGFDAQPGGMFYPLFAQVSADGFSGQWTIACSNHFFSATLLASTWYRVRTEWDGTTERIKVWKVGDPEPAAWGASGAGAVYGSGGATTLEIFGPSSTARTAMLDNVVIWDSPAISFTFAAETGLITVSGNRPLPVGIRFDAATGLVTLTGSAPHSIGVEHVAPGTITVSGANVGPSRFVPPSGQIDVRGRKPSTEMTWPGPPTRHPIGDPANEIWLLSLDPATTGGTFSLIADGGLGDSGPIPWNVNAAGLQTILQASWGPGMSVTGTPMPTGLLRVEFTGAFGNLRFTVVFGTLGLTTGGGPSPAPPPPVEDQVGQPGGFGDDGHGNPAIQILVGGHDLTRRILYRDAEFTSSTNGDVGSCHFRVRDLDPLNRLSTAIRTGDEIFVRFKGINQWQGFVRQVGYAYSLSAEDVDSFPERFFVIEGADVNILFNSRVVYHQTNPGTEGRKLYTVKKGPTKDITAIEELVTHWLDIGGDNIDTESLVDHVGNINVDQDAVPWTAGMRWGDAMKGIALLPAAIFCIDPDRRLVFADVDRPSSPYEALSDHQSRTTAPYREMEIVNDGSDLVTDVMAWGIGTGSKLPVFKRIQDDSEGHGLWQDGELRFDVYKQSTINRIATSIIEGSPSSHRGRKMDKIAVKATTFVPGYRAGQRIVFRSYAWSFYDVIPIRQMRITFPIPSMPKFELTMSHQTDEPWSFYDVFDFTAATVTDRSYLILPEAQDYSYPIHLGSSFLVTCRTPGINTPILVDDFNRPVNWFTNWGDGGCGPWTHTGAGAGLQFGISTVKSPAPHCFAIATHGTLYIASAAGAAEPIYGGSWSVSIDRSGGHLVLGAGIGYQGAPASTVSGPNVSGQTILGYHGNPATPIPDTANYIVRMVRDQLSMKVRVWAIEDKEPTYWHASLTPVIGPGVSDGYAADTEPDFVGGVPMGGYFEVRTTGIFAVYVSGGVGWGWVWYQFPLTDSIDPSHIYVNPWNHGWERTYYPPGTFPVNPDIVGAVQPIDAISTSLGDGNYSPIARPESFTKSGPGSLVTYTLAALHWAWNSDNGLDGTSQPDGRMIADTQRFPSFLAPPGAYTIHLRFRVYMNAPETGIFSLGSQPGPTGEGALTYDLWSAKYNGEDVVQPDLVTHTIIGSGVVADYNYGPELTEWGPGANLVNYVDHDITLPIHEFEVFQLSGRITNPYQSLINTHGPTGSFAANSGGRRVIELKITNVKVSFGWAPVACIDDAQYGEVSFSVTGIIDPVIYLGSPYWDGTTRVFKNGGILVRGHEADSVDAIGLDLADYMETSPLDGTITLTAAPAATDSFTIVFRGSSDTGWSGLPKEIKTR